MQTLRILVTDDEAEMRRAVERALREFTVLLPDVNEDVHFELDTAGTGEEALEKINANPPDLILLDYKLPGISGLDVLEQLGKREGDIHTVMMTAYASLETAVTATKQGAFDFIAKPFTPTELKETVRKTAAHLIVQRKARQLALEKRQVRFQFISVLAHELKAPLSAIEGYLELLKDPDTRSNGSVAEPMVQRSLIRCQGMRKMITDLLDLTRIESGTKVREIVEVDVAEVARTAIDTMRPDADHRGITVELQVDGLSKMPGDRGEIEIILNNLVSNAVKYNRDGGRVDVKIAGNDSKIVLTVTDTGIGMNEEEAGRLFNDFVRIRNTKTKDILGSGLGLSIVRKLAQLYAGDARVASKPDVGSTFTVELARGSVSPEPQNGTSRNTELVA